MACDFSNPGKQLLVTRSQLFCDARVSGRQRPEVLNAVNGKYSQFLSWLGIDCFILLESQEIDEAPFRTTLWFKYPHRITVCINEEVALLRNFNPDRVRGVFRFTTSKLKYNLSPNFHHLWILTK